DCVTRRFDGSSAALKRFVRLGLRLGHRLTRSAESKLRLREPTEVGKSLAQDWFPISHGTRLQSMRFNNPASLNKKRKQKMTTLGLRKSIHWWPLRRRFVLITLTFVCFGISPIAQAQSPSPTLSPTAESTLNTTVGDSALQSNTTGYSNTAIGAGALMKNTS